MSDLLATMFTMTTYGTWLRGDRRGWVSRGEIYPADPELEDADRHRMKHTPFLFSKTQLFDIGTMIGQALIERLELPIYALTVGTWHVHLVVDQNYHRTGVVAKCAKDAVRHGLKPGRPIWTTGYDKRYCFDESSALTRVKYVERHNEASGLDAAPWPFLNDVTTFSISPG